MFDTEAARTAQERCTHIIACAVDASTRERVIADEVVAREVGDTTGALLALARLTGPCVGALVATPAPARVDYTAPGSPPFSTYPGQDTP
jgi:hypothetical protein